MTHSLQNFEGLQARLSTALARLEGEVDKHRRGKEEAVRDIEAKLTQTMAERDQLRAALEASEQEAARLKEFARSLADELDKAASQIERLLGATLPAA